MFEKYQITEDSFGAICPENWKNIATLLNEKITNKFAVLDKNGADDEEYRCEADKIWENYCNGNYDSEI